ncbi:M15 family metallopeptidase [Nocardia sp. NPDC004568]|uniref:M15 family metallopeptidase n=1 Tax=Nocardia sp. NPDC004568 TaxID=3154551 RepID=UPI0033AF6110
MVVVGAVAIGALVHLVSRPSSTAPTDVIAHDDDRGSSGAADPQSPRRRGASERATRSGGTVTEGAVPLGVTVFDDEIPAVANLRPDLLGALRQAATDAAEDGIQFVVNSGWRSAQYQGQLLREAVVEYGSAEEAARWVAAPDKSAHVSGDAVDIGPSEASTWLSEHGAGYGLCQIYRNEPWHYELRPEAADHGCPPQYADPTEDPRTQQ